MKESWLDSFQTREQKEIDFARLYATQYQHGTPGHTHLMIIAKLAELLDEEDKLAVEFAITRNLVNL